MKGSVFATSLRTLQWARAIFFECLAMPLTFILYPLGFIPFCRRPTGNLSGRPILLVHGYLNNSAVWFYHRMKLRQAGFGPIYTIDLGHPFKSIRYHAREVERKAEKIAHETKRDDLILIGHSMGGLVSCLYAGELAGRGKVTDVMTLGSPLCGTPVASMALGEGGREMERNSELVKEIADSIARNRIHTRFYTIAAQCDQLVIPGTSALLTPRNKKHQLLIPDLGHAALLYSPRVSRKICEWLKSIE